MLSLIRPLRFILFSLPLFLFWEYVLRQHYLTAIAHAFAATARLFGQDVHLLELQGSRMTFWYGLEKWSNEFGLTGVNLVPLVALILATGHTTWHRRFRMLVIGVLLLATTHILGLWSDVLSFNVRDDPAATRIVSGLRSLLTGLGIFLFPVLIWLVLVRDLLPELATRKAETTG